MDQIYVAPGIMRSPKKRVQNPAKREVESIKSTYADVVLGTDIVGFKLPNPTENSVPTFNSHIGNQCFIKLFFYVSYNNNNYTLVKNFIFNSRIYNIFR